MLEVTEILVEIYLSFFLASKLLGDIIMSIIMF